MPLSAVAQFQREADEMASASGKFMSYSWWRHHLIMDEHLTSLQATEQALRKLGLHVPNKTWEKIPPSMPDAEAIRQSTKG